MSGIKKSLESEIFSSQQPPLRRWVENIGQSPLYVSDGGENKSKFRV